MYIYKIKLL